MKPARPIVNGSDTAFTGNLKRWGADVVDALGSLSDHPGMRVPFPFEVRRGWETGDSESSWGVHGGAIQVGSTVYKCDVTETLGDGRRWQPIDDPDGKLAESPLDCTIYAGIQGGFVVFSTDPAMETDYVYATPIAILDGVRLVQLIVGNVRIGGDGEGGGCIRLEASGWSGATVEFDATYQTNPAVIELIDDEGVDKMACYVSGVYHMDIAVDGYVPVGVNLAGIDLTIKNSSDEIEQSFTLEQRYTDKVAGADGTERIKVSASKSFDVLGSSTEQWRMIPTVTYGTITRLTWTAHLVQAWEAPPDT